MTLDHRNTLTAQFHASGMRTIDGLRSGPTCPASLGPSSGADLALQRVALIGRTAAAHALQNNLVGHQCAMSVGKKSRPVLDDDELGSWPLVR